MGGCAVTSRSESCDLERVWVRCPASAPQRTVRKMPEWGALLLVAVTGWVVVSMVLGMVIGALFARVPLEPQSSLKAARRWGPTKRRLRARPIDLRLKIKKLS